MMTELSHYMLENVILSLLPFLESHTSRGITYALY